MEVLFRTEMLSSNYPKNENECFKFIDNNWYVIGKDNTIENFESDGIELCLIVNKYGAWIGKKNTKAINFEDMLDSQGNKIFASLSASGKGGDILNSGYGEVIIAVYEEGMIKFRYEEALPYNHTTIDEIEDEDFLAFYEVWQIRDKLESEVIGIQK